MDLTELNATSCLIHRQLFPAIERVNTNLQRNLQQIVEQDQPVELKRFKHSPFSLFGCER